MTITCGAKPLTSTPLSIRPSVELGSALAKELTVADTVRLLDAMQDLSCVRTMQDVQDTVRRWARELIGADGVTFVLREGNDVYYAEENAIAPLWKGRRFPAQSCISGWAMLHRQAVAIVDIYADSRVPIDAYKPTFVKSLAMVPVRQDDPIAAIGAYWADHHVTTTRELGLLQAFANATSVALANEEALRIRDDFLSIASHELRTPLTALHLQLEGVRRLVHTNPALESRIPEKINRTVRSLERLTKLVEQLLDVSRLTQGTFKLNYEELELVELTREVVERFHEQAQEAGSPITVQTSETSLVGWWDKLGLEQMLSNLVSNAIKYGGNKPIEVTLSVQPQSVSLSVTDQGIGINPQDHERIFGRFERAASIRNYGGLGLGLFIARQIALVHGGNIHIQSAPRQGSTFILELPRNQQEL